MSFLLTCKFYRPKHFKFLFSIFINFSYPQIDVYQLKEGNHLEKKIWKNFNLPQKCHYSAIHNTFSIFQQFLNTFHSSHLDVVRVMCLLCCRKKFVMIVMPEAHFFHPPFKHNATFAQLMPESIYSSAGNKSEFLSLILHII